ncbi:MAG: radical SAM family heme chaperone HemW, partial [Pseudomonadota bacterium]
YVHVPWCVRKCPYCDFNSHHLRGELPAQAYVDALLDDLRLDLESEPKTTDLTSIFIGGGTPSLLPVGELERLLKGIGALLHLPSDAEITLEANPGTIERQAFADFRSAGVNRVSIGVQSFNEAHLRDLGRIHDGEAAIAAAREAIREIPRVNLDLMFALPNQSLESCIDDLQRAVGLGAEHISHYELTIEPNTVFARYTPDGLPDEDLAGDMREASEELLGQAGYQPYEISAYATAAQARSRHNLNYWQYGDYLGIGAGAHGKTTHWPATDRSGVPRIHRVRKVRSPRTFLDAASTRLRVAHHEEVDEVQRVGEFMLNALRLVDGFSEALFESRTGVPGERIRAALQQLEIEGLMETTAPGKWRPTSRGRAFTNDLQARFVD